jgi:hypothetical protein
MVKASHRFLVPVHVVGRSPIAESANAHGFIDLGI